VKHSLRFRLFGLTTGLMLAFVLVSFLLNALFLQPWYIGRKTASLQDTYPRVVAALQLDATSRDLALEKIENELGVYIAIADENLNRVYGTRQNQPNISGVPLPTLPASGGSTGLPDGRGGFGISDERQVLDNLPLFKATPVVSRYSDARTGATFLSLSGKDTTADGAVYYILLRTSIQQISDSASIANGFFLIVGLFTILLGGLFAYLLARTVTRPVLEISRTAKAMAVLDFSHKIDVRTDDEVGELGQSVNSLSTQLEGAISELRAANKELQADIERKERIDQLRKEFVSNVSHELKTPIALILGYAEGLKLRINEDEKDMYCDVIVDEARQMNRIVVRLLDLAQLDAGEVRLDRTEFSVKALVERGLERYALPLRDAGVTVTAEGPDLALYADEERIEQSFDNYLTNAIHYVGGDKRIDVRWECLDGKVRLSVFDTGDGIPEASLPRVWESFYKVDKSRTRSYGGTGLGLHIVQSVVHAHGGTCGAANVPGGVDFWFEIPMDGTPPESRGTDA